MFTPLMVALLVANVELCFSVSLMRAAKCIIPNGLEHITRGILFQQCISENYGLDNETRCYDELGCFPMDYPWTTPTRPFPSPLHPAEINVRLYCYTKASPKRYYVTLWPEISLKGCPLDSENPVAFIIHGFINSGNMSWPSALKDHYLTASPNATVIIVDWGQGALRLNYLRVSSNTRIVGAEVARFISWLQNTTELNVDKVHLMGHSLGAHIAGYTGKRIPDIGRITGMDPAQPGFEFEAEEVRLQKTDAKFVDIIHTNALPFVPGLGFGAIFPLGHVDFYMNGGLRQPGCHIPEVKIQGIEDLAKIPVEVLYGWVACSHNRAHEYFMHVLNSDCMIWGHTASLPVHAINAVTLGYIDPLFSMLKKCNRKTCLPLGLMTPKFPGRGVFAAYTHNSAPFCDDDPEINERVLFEIENEDSEEESLIENIVRVEDAEKVVKTARLASNIPHSIIDFLG